MLILTTCQLYNHNWDVRLETWPKAEQSFQSFCRAKAISGKQLLIIHILCISSLSYLVDIYTNNIPDKFIVKTKDLMQDFLWSGKTYRHIGLELQDTDNLVLCKKLNGL